MARPSTTQLRATPAQRKSTGPAPGKAKPRPSAKARAAAERRRRAARTRLRIRRGLLALILMAAAAALIVPRLPSAVQEIALPLRHEDIIRQQAADKALDPALIAAVIKTESNFRDGQTSSAGALGLMQLTPATATYIAQKSGGHLFEIADLATPQVNVAYGSYYLRYLLGRYDGNQTLALAAYNAGPGNVDRWVAQTGRDDRSLRPADIPFAETRAYVRLVDEAQRAYRRTYAAELGY